MTYHIHQSMSEEGGKGIRTLINIQVNTVRGKILEGEIFGELMALKSLARKNLANLLVVY